jgi:ABC-type transport system involved in Fe-S cluster assembly fused permease/ATPase subunit
MRPNRNSTVDLDKPAEWSVLKKLSPYLVEYKSRVVLALFCMVLAKGAVVAMPFALKHIVDGLNGEVEQMLAAPIALVIVYGVLRFAGVIMGEVRDTLFGRVTERAMRRIGLKVFTHLHSLELDFHLNRKTGALSRDMERGTSGVSFLMRFMVFNIVPTLIEVGMVIGILLYKYGWEFSTVILVAIIAYITWSVQATKWRTEYVREANKADNQANARAVDSLLNYETVKYFNNEQHEIGHYDDDLADWEQARRKNRLSLFALNGGQAFVIATAVTAMMLLAAYQVKSGGMTIGDFVLINAFTMQIFLPLNFLGFVYREIKGSLANIERMFNLLEQQPKIIDEENAKSLHVSQAQVEFNQVEFGYRADRRILNNVSFKVPAGHKVAIVGESGSGKSTLVKLLFRFYDLDKGTILIDDQDISLVSQLSLRTHIGIVPQDTVLFNDSIFENVRYGKPDAEDSEVWNAIELAHLGDFINTLPDRENTIVGERGLKLSGGEKQRVAIARTLLKRPEILVFDEATSSLDSHSEQAILKAMKDVAQGHSTLVIAHRLSTIVDADNIVVMRQGEIVEQGSHQQLLAADGVYATMWQVQQQEQS